MSDTPERLTSLEPVFVEHIPEILEAGKLYISLKYETSSHNCACGCGERTVLPFGEGGWTMTHENETVTFTPSIGNFQFVCKSHYYITKNQIQWL